MMIRNMINRLSLVLGLFKEFTSDFIGYAKYNIDGWKTPQKERLISRMLLTAHSLEKGMSFEKKKKNWGEAKALSLCDMVNRYEKYGVDEYLALALNVLYKYSIDSYSSKNEKLIKNILCLVEKYSSLLKPDDYGTKQVGEPPAFNEALIKEFFKTRSSVRFYKDKDVSEDDIRQAYDLAKLTPSACNRQTCKVYVYRNIDIKNRILDNQLGNQGWADKAPVLFVVTSDISRFGGTYEHSQALIDGGLFAMNFAWGLHLKHIGACFKMYIREHNRTEEFRKICSIPANEIPIVLILAGYYDDKPISCPMSHRFDQQIIFNE